MQHSSLGASSAHRWMKCAGSVSLSETVEDYAEQSPYAAEGTLAHSYVEQALSPQPPDIDPLEVSDEMAEHTGLYIKLIETFQEMCDWSELEHQFDLADLNPPVDAYGTADFVGYNAGDHSLIVADLKYGQGVVVEVEGNVQLMYYGLGALIEFQKQSPGVLVEQIRMVIVQPRAYHPDGKVRELTIPIEEMFAFADELITAMHKTQAPEPEFVAGDHCRWCRASAICPTLLDYNQKLAQMDFSEGPIKADVTGLSLDQLSHLLDNLDKIEHWVASVRQYAQGELTAGREIPGWKMVQKRAIRKWLDEATTISWLVADLQLPEDDITVTKLKSPAQIEKLIDDKVPDEYVTKNSSGTKLARADSNLPDAAPVGSEFFND